MREDRYFIVYIRGDTETVICSYGDKCDADNELNRIKRESKLKRGAYQEILAYVLPTGKPDAYRRRYIDGFSPEVEIFIRKLLKD